MTATRIRRTALACVFGLLLASTPAGSKPQQPAGRPTHGAAVEGSRHHAGITARNAPPGSMHRRNLAGTDGAGLCVFASIAHAADYQGIEGLDRVLEWMTRHPGGGWPEKVDRVLEAMLGPDHGIEYLHVEGPEAFPLLERASREGLLPCVSLGYSERYPELGYQMDHMVNVPHFGEEWVCVLDNNHIGEDRFEWIPRAEFEVRSSWSSRGPYQVWAIIFFSGTPQPPEPLP